MNDISRDIYPEFFPAVTELPKYSMKAGFILSLIAVIALMALLPKPGRTATLDGRSRVDLKLGAWLPANDPEDGILEDMITVSSPNDGILTGVGFGHWFSEKWAVTLSVSSIYARSDYRSGIIWSSTSHSNIIPILLGCRYYFNGDCWRPFLAFSAGPFIGVQSRVKTGTDVIVDNVTRSAIGCRFGGGVDCQLSRIFMLGMDIGYNLMTDFSGTIGNRENYSGPDVTLRLSALLGKSRQ